MASAWFLLLLALGLNISALQWSSCGGAGDAIHLSQLVVTPEVLTLPGPVTVTATGKLDTNITDTVKLALTMRKKMPVIGYIKVPCEDGMGSCTYDDVCLLSPYKDACPPEFDKAHVPCKCPVKQGSYSVKDFAMNVTGRFPRFLVKGKYKVNALITRGSVQLGCFDIKVSMI